MFDFQHRDDGFVVFDTDGRSVCSVECAETTYDHDTKYRVPQKVVTIFQKENWRIHFCARKLSVPEMRELLAQIEQIKFATNGG